MSQEINNKEDHRLNHLPSNSIIIGFTGAISSGCTRICTEIVDYFKNKINCRSCKLSSIIDEELKKEGIDNLTVQEKQDRGDKLRQSRGKSYLASAIIKKIDDEFGISKKIDSMILLDGIKNHGEVYFLRNYFPNFFLFSVQAPKEIRKNRWLRDQLKKKPNADQKKLKQIFDAADARDEHEEDVNGQQVGWCNYLADIVIYNDKDIGEHEEDASNKYFNEKAFFYVNLIDQYLKREYKKEIHPKTDELCMTLAYALSKKSSCCKRKVGALLIETIMGDQKGDKNEIHEIPIIVSSGYNEVLLNTKPCILDSNYNGCRRDYIKNKIVSKYNNCPNCGTKLALDKEKSKCETCNFDILENTTADDDDISINFLDICRAVHAEEMAILHLSKRGYSPDNDLTLYTTTQPCNLCANKIITLQKIKRVVYSEPYAIMKVNEMIEKADIKLVPFEGVKGPAFYKLYFSDVKLEEEKNEE